MKKSNFWQILIALVLILQFYSPTAMLANSGKFSNPVLFADVPDVNVIRVGTDYYMVSTTMHLMPGAPIMRSKDLVNWEIVSYVFDEIKDSPQYDLLEGNVYGRGQWASSLRYHKGTFYVLFATNSPQRTYIYKTTNPAGKWEKHAQFNRTFHDCSLFIDDDERAYLIFGGGQIRLRELTPDLKALKEGGEDKIIIDGPAAGYKNLFEGTHVFKHNGRYYFYLIWWPQGGIRTQVCFRSDSLMGEFESKVVLSNTLDRRGAGLAQGCIVDTPEGEWYGMLFQDRGAVGRVPMLMPCRWVDGWPMLGDEAGKVAKIMKSPLPLQKETPLVVSDEFDNNKLGLTWQWNHNPDNAKWSLAERKGHMRLHTVRVVSDIFAAPNTLSQRTEGPQCSGQVKLDVSKMKDGDVAGLSVYCAEPGMLSVVMEGKNKFLVMSDRNVEKERIALKKNKVMLRVDADFRNGTDKANFYYSLDNKKWTKIGTEFQMVYNLRHFMGNRLAIYNFATKNTGGWVDVDYFRYSREKEALD